MLDAVEVFIQNLLSRFDDILSVAVVGSRITNRDADKESDLDVVVLVDDCSDNADKESTSAAIKEIARKINELFHVQVYFLKEFWKYVEAGSPVTFTIIRDSRIYYDIGFFETLQKLVNANMIQPKTEAVERQLAIAKQLMKITYHSVNMGLIQNLEGAIVSSTQSLLMQLGVEPPTPKEVPVYIKKFLVEKNILADEYYIIARRVIQTYKDIEHNKKPPLSGKELQDLYNDTSRFVLKAEEIISRMKNFK